MTTTNRDYMQTHSNAFNADLEKITLPTCSLLELTSTSTKVTTGSWQLAATCTGVHTHVVLQVMVVGMCIRDQVCDIPTHPLARGYWIQNFIILVADFAKIF